MSESVPDLQHSEQLMAMYKHVAWADTVGFTPVRIDQLRDSIESVGYSSHGLAVIDNVSEAGYETFTVFNPALNADEVAALRPHSTIYETREPISATAYRLPLRSQLGYIATEATLPGAALAAGELTHTLGTTDNYILLGMAALVAASTAKAQRRWAMRRDAKHQVKAYHDLRERIIDKDQGAVWLPDIQVPYFEEWRAFNDHDRASFAAGHYILSSIRNLIDPDKEQIYDQRNINPAEAFRDLVCWTPGEAPIWEEYKLGDLAQRLQSAVAEVQHSSQRLEEGRSIALGDTPIFMRRLVEERQAAMASLHLLHDEIEQRRQEMLKRYGPIMDQQILEQNIVRQTEDGSLYGQLNGIELAELVALTNRAIEDANIASGAKVRINKKLESLIRLLAEDLRPTTAERTYIEVQDAFKEQIRFPDWSSVAAILIGRPVN